MKYVNVSIKCCLLTWMGQKPSITFNMYQRCVVVLPWLSLFSNVCSHALISICNVCISILNTEFCSVHIYLYILDISLSEAIPVSKSILYFRIIHSAYKKYSNPYFVNTILVNNENRFTQYIQVVHTYNCPLKVPNINTTQVLHCPRSSQTNQAHNSVLWTANQTVWSRTCL